MKYKMKYIIEIVTHHIIKIIGCRLGYKYTARPVINLLKKKKMT